MSDILRSYLDIEYPFEFSKIKDLLSSGQYELVCYALTKDYHYTIVEELIRNEIFKIYLRIRRDLWIEKYKSWALPPTYQEMEMIKSCIGKRKILEVGSGSGFYAAFFKSAGMNIIATDSKIEGGDSVETYTKVEKRTCNQALKKYGNKVGCLFVCWGRGFPTEEDFSYFKGDMVISIGEDGGCTSSGYIDTLPENPNWKLEEKIEIGTWPKIRDSIKIYRKMNNF